MKIHPSDFLLEEMLFRAGGNRPALLSHLSRCRFCQQRVDSLQPTNSQAAAPPAATTRINALVAAPHGLRDLQSQTRHGLPDYGALIDRSERKYLDRARQLEHERTEAPALLTELLGHPRERRGLLLANSSRFHTWGVYEHLLDRSWDLRTSEAEDAEELARLALQLSDLLDSSYYSAPLIEDLRARGWSYIGNLRRMRSDLEGAEKALATAYACLKKGSREPFERAVFLELKAPLRRAQRRFGEAASLLQHAIKLFERLGDDLRAARCLIGLAVVYEVQGDLERTIEVLQKASPMVPAEEHYLFLTCRHNTVHSLVSAGRFIEAQGQYRKISHLYKRFEGAPISHRQFWIKGRIERGLGQSASAEALFLYARERFLQKNIPYEAALVSLDLASLYAEQHRFAEIKKLAAEALPILTARNIHREAVAAFAFLVQAADAERISSEVVAQVATFMRRLEQEPTLKFEAPA